MDEYLWSHCYFIVLRSGTLWGGKNYRCRKIQIFTSQFADFAKYRFSFPFANCSKPFFLIPCLSQFLKLIVRLPLNYSFFYVFKGLVSGNGNLFQHFSPLTMLDSLSKSVDVQVFCVFSSSVNQNGLFLNYWKKWVLCIRNRFHAKQHCVVLKIINLIYSIYNGLSFVFFSQNWFVSYIW